MVTQISSETSAQTPGRVIFSFQLIVALKLDYPELGPHIRQSITFLVMSGAFETILENLSKSIICSPGRTINRIRSPRLAASGR